MRDRGTPSPFPRRHAVTFGDDDASTRVRTAEPAEGREKWRLSSAVHDVSGTSAPGSKAVDVQLVRSDHPPSIADNATSRRTSCTSWRTSERWFLTS